MSAVAAWFSTDKSLAKLESIPKHFAAHHFVQAVLRITTRIHLEIVPEKQASMKDCGEVEDKKLKKIF